MLSGFGSIRDCFQCDFGTPSEPLSAFFFLVTVGLPHLAIVMVNSVCTVLEGTKTVVSQRWAALWSRWMAVTRFGPAGPIVLVEPWTHWISLDLRGFSKWQWILKTRHRRVLPKIHLGVHEPEKMGEDDTSRISPEETLMTKNPGAHYINQFYFGQTSA